METQNTTFRERLKNETAEEHRHLESASRIMKPEFSREDYKAILAKWSLFYSAFESEIDRHQTEFPDAAKFMEARRKADLLKADLRFFGIKAEASTPHDLQGFLKDAFNSRGALWGALYVLEGSTLGAQVITRHLATQLDLENNDGLHFYRGYGDQTGLQWRSFIGELSTLGLSPAEETAGVETAKHLFRFLGRFLEA